MFQILTNDISDYVQPEAPIYFDEDMPFIDFAFIDASKVEYLDYFKLIHPNLVKGGMIVADNTISHESILKGYNSLLQLTVITTQ